MSSASTMSAPPVPLLTAEEFAERPDPGYPEELVRGRIVPMSIPRARHGQICAKSVYILQRFLEDNDLGHVLCNDSGIITERGPDTVRGADLAFYSYARLPKGPLPNTYSDVAPELVIEVRSPSDRWPQILAKVAEYLEAGVLVVVVLDDERREADVYGVEGPRRKLGAEDALEVPDLLPGFSAAVRRFLD